MRQSWIRGPEAKLLGAPHDSAAVRRDLKVPGDASVTLVLYRRGKVILAILAERTKVPG